MQPKLLKSASSPSTPPAPYLLEPTYLTPFLLLLSVWSPASRLPVRLSAQCEMEKKSKRKHTFTKDKSFWVKTQITGLKLQVRSGSVMSTTQVVKNSIFTWLESSQSELSTHRWCLPPLGNIVHWMHRCIEFTSLHSDYWHHCTKGVQAGNMNHWHFLSHYIYENLQNTKLHLHKAYYQLWWIFFSIKATLGAQSELELWHKV